MPRRLARSPDQSHRAGPGVGSQGGQAPASSGGTGERNSGADARRQARRGSRRDGPRDRSSLSSFLSRRPALRSPSVSLWRKASITCCGSLVLLVAISWTTVASAVALWSNDPLSHGYLVIP